MNLRDIGLLFLLAALWGGSFLFIRVAAPVLNPAPLVEIRVVLAGVFLLIYARLSNQKFSPRASWRHFLILGALNAAIPFTLVAFATLTITASLAAILNAATPLFTALISAVWLRESLTKKKLIGLIGGIFGVSLVVGFDPVAYSPAAILAIAAALLAPLSYALGGVYSKSVSSGEPPLALAIGQQLAAGLLLFPFAAATIPSSPPSITIILAVLALALLSTAVGYLIFYQLIARIGATNTLSVTLLVPIFGTIWGAVILGEPVTLVQISGLFLILASLVLITGLNFRPK
jgi:drug/metabolite transporter (DMT)-like permease